MNKIRELRRESNMTMKELGKVIGVAESTVSLYETGSRQPDLETIIKLANFFRVSTDYLLGRNDISEEERAAGWQSTKKISITPDEDDMLYYFRELGRLYGKEMQQAQINMMKNIVEVKK